jgi:membrane protease YdiL (CAAX protease family)
MQIKNDLREFNLFYMLAFLGTGMLYGGSLMLCRLTCAGSVETGLITTMAAQFAPAVAAFVTQKRNGTALNLQFRLKPQSGLLLCLLVPLLGVGSQSFFYDVTGYPAVKSAFFSGTPLALLTIVTTLLGSIGEEIGWRGYLHKSLRNYMKTWISSGLTGLFWGLWHFTKIFNQGIVFYFSFTLSVLPLSILMTYVNEKTGDSLLPSILIHAAFNLSFMYFLYERETIRGHLVSTVCLSLLLLAIRLLDPAYFRQQNMNRPQQ